MMFLLISVFRSQNYHLKSALNIPEKGSEDSAGELEIITFAFSLFVSSKLKTTLIVRNTQKRVKFQTICVQKTRFTDGLFPH